MTDFFNTLKPSGSEKSTNIPGYNNRLTKWNETVERIISDYENLIKVKPIIGSGSDSIVPTDSNETSGGSTESVSPVTTTQNWLIIVLSNLLSFLFGIFLCYYFIKSRIYYFLGDDIETYKNSISYTGLFSFFLIIKLLKKRKDYYKNKDTEAERENTEKSEKESSPENNSTAKTSRDPVETEKTKVSVENQAKSVEQDLYKEGRNKSTSYFSIPENDGRFIIDKGEQTNDGSKYYKIVCRTNSDEGDLFYISGPQDRRAINRLDSYLKPVCDIDNIINAESASKIEVLKNGKVIKISDSWVIDTTHKVKIKLV